MNEFMTWEYQLTFAGCVAGTAILTEFIKKIPGIAKVPTQFVSYVIAFAIMVVGQLAIDTLTWQKVALDAVNAAVVSLSSNGVFDAIEGAFDRITDKAFK